MSTGDLGSAALKMVFTLIGLILLLFLTYWLLRRVIQQRLQKGVGTVGIQILEKKMLSPKTMLYVLEVNKKKILVAESHLEIKRIESFGTVKE